MQIEKMIAELFEVHRDICQIDGNCHRWATPAPAKTSSEIAKTQITSEDELMVYLHTHVRVSEDVRTCFVMATYGDRGVCMDKSGYTCILKHYNFGMLFWDANCI